VSSLPWDHNITVRRQKQKGKQKHVTTPTADNQEPGANQIQSLDMMNMEEDVDGYYGGTEEDLLEGEEDSNASASIVDGDFLPGVMDTFSGDFSGQATAASSFPSEPEMSSSRHVNNWVSSTIDGTFDEGSQWEVYTDRSSADINYLADVEQDGREVWDPYDWAEESDEENYLLAGQPPGATNQHAIPQFDGAGGVYRSDFLLDTNSSIRLPITENAYRLSTRLGDTRGVFDDQLSLNQPESINNSPNNHTLLEGTGAAFFISRTSTPTRDRFFGVEMPSSASPLRRSFSNLSIRQSPTRASPYINTITDETDNEATDTARIEEDIPRSLSFLRHMARSSSRGVVSEGEFVNTNFPGQPGSVARRGARRGERRRRELAMRPIR
jgi:hypothetical protein